MGQRFLRFRVLRVDQDVARELAGSDYQPVAWKTVQPMLRRNLLFLFSCSRCPSASSACHRYNHWGSF